MRDWVSSSWGRWLSTRWAPGGLPEGAPSSAAVPRPASVLPYRLAQFNVARMRAPIDDPVMEGFRSQLDRINAIADESPGFVWRLQTAAGEATAVRAYPDPLTIVNMSVWESLEALHEYVYRSPHVAPLRERRRWFEPASGPILVLWWVRAGHLPTVQEAMEKLDHLQAHGPSPTAFTFREPFPPPGEAAVRAPDVDAEFCSERG
jgi:hypothetical protein